MSNFGPGEILSEGTLLSADLIRSFVFALDVGQSKMEMSQDLRDGKHVIENWSDESINNPDHSTSDGSANADYIGGILEGLIDELNGLAPDGCYFGSHPDDGALYGFFEQEEM